MMPDPHDDVASARMAVEGARGALTATGWVWVPAEEQGRLAVPPQHATVPSDFVVWASSFASFSNRDETAWFLSTADYADRDAEGFAWNTFETMSVEATTTDEETSAVVRFWERHLPILLTVGGEYGFLALVTSGVGGGAVVFGEEPEFEETIPVAESFSVFMEMVAGRRAPVDARVWERVFGADSVQIA